MGAKNNKSDKAKDTATGKFSGSPSSKSLADVQNKQGTKYGGKLAGAIARANERHRARSLAGRKEAAALAAIQAQEAKQVTPTQAGITSMMDRMQKDRQNLLDKAKKNRITNQQLNQLGKLNKDLGFNRTTGMGVIESLRDQFTKPEFKQGIGNLVKAYQKFSPMGLLMRNILNPQYEEETGIQSLPEFKGLQRTNQMFGPGVYDFTKPTRMPMQFADTPTQFADASQSDINTINFMKQSMPLPDIQRFYEGTTVTPEEVEGIYEGTITSPTGQFAII